MPETRAVLFDLDGTLVDSAFVHTTCWWQALLGHDHVVPMALIHRAVGLGADKILDHLLGADHPADERADDDAIVAAHDALFTTWRERVRPLPGAAELLRWCHGSGRAVVIATSSGGSDLTALLGRLDADDAISATTTADDAEHSKPDTDILEVALERAGVGAPDAVYVGDAVWDMMAATRAGMVAIGLESGGVSAAELRTAGASEVWRDPADLLAHADTSALTRH